MTHEVRPTEPIPTSDDPKFRSMSEDFERHFFALDEQVRFEITLMRETWDQIREMITEYNWQPNEGLIILLATGMAYLRAEHALDVATDVAGYKADDLKRLLERSITIESKYAAIRNFAFSLMRDHRTLEIKCDPMEREYHIYRALANRLRTENDALKAENERLKRTLTALEAAPAVLPSTLLAGPVRLWRRIITALRGHS